MVLFDLSFNTEEGLVQVIQALYEHSSSAVLLNKQLGELFQTTVGVRQGCLLSTVLFSLFQEEITHETLQDYHTSISIGGRPLCNLQFADNIDIMGGSCNELQDLTNRLAARARAYGMEFSTEKSTVMVNGTKEISINITMNGQPLEEVTSFKYLGATLSNDGTCRAEIRMVTATAVMARVNRMLKAT